MRGLLLGVLLLMLLAANVAAVTLYADDDGVCGGNTPCFNHVQDAVNAASPGDTIRVYPGTYGSRCYYSKPPHWGPNDQCAPALIVWKPNLVIQAVDPNPANTVIQSTHDVWSNKAGGAGSGGAIEASTGCTFVNSNWVGTCVRPTFAVSPNGVIVIANGVTIEGFTIRSTYRGDPTNYGCSHPNTAAVMVGGLYAGDLDYQGVSGTTIRNNVLSGWSGVYVWKSPSTTIQGNTISIIDTITTTDQKCKYPLGSPINVWDGWNQGSISSKGLRIIGNSISTIPGTEKAVSIAGYDETNPNNIDHSGFYMDGNTIVSHGHGVLFWNSLGSNKIITCNNVVNVPPEFKQVNVIEPSTYDGLLGIPGACKKKTVPIMGHTLLMILGLALAGLGTKLRQIA